MNNHIPLFYLDMIIYLCDGGICLFYKLVYGFVILQIDTSSLFNKQRLGKSALINDMNK